MKDGYDLCPYVSDADQDDLDDDGQGDTCDADADGDGHLLGADCDDTDAAVHASTVYYADPDEDGIGDGASQTLVCGGGALDDYVATGGDNCPEDANADQADSDGDGYGDACDIEATPGGEVGGGGGCSTGPSSDVSPGALLAALMMLMPLFRRRRSR